MPFRYGFYNSVNGDRKYSSEDMGALFDGIITDGVFDSIGEIFAVTPGDGLQVIVGSGKAWFNRTWNINDAPFPVNLDDPDVILDRYDAIVLEVNSGETARENSIKAVKGVAASQPTKPGLANSETLKQYPLAYIRVRSGSTVVLKSDIENMIGKTECPFVTSVIESVDISDLFIKWEGDFEEWFENVKGQLSGDVAANLQRQIDEIKLKVEYSMPKVGDVKISARTDLSADWVLCNGDLIDDNEYPELSIVADPYQIRWLPHWENNVQITSARPITAHSSTSYAYDGRAIAAVSAVSYSSRQVTFVYGEDPTDLETIQVTMPSDLPVSGGYNLCDVKYNPVMRVWLLLFSPSSTPAKRVYIYKAESPEGPWTSVPITGINVNAAYRAHFYIAENGNTFLMIAHDGSQWYPRIFGSQDLDTWTPMNIYEEHGGFIYEVSLSYSSTCRVTKKDKVGGSTIKYWDIGTGVSSGIDRTIFRLGAYLIFDRGIVDMAKDEWYAYPNTISGHGHISAYLTNSNRLIVLSGITTIDPEYNVDERPQIRMTLLQENGTFMALGVYPSSFPLYWSSDCDAWIHVFTRPDNSKFAIGLYGVNSPDTFTAKGLQVQNIKSYLPTLSADGVYYYMLAKEASLNDS